MGKMGARIDDIHTMKEDGWVDRRTTELALERALSLQSYQTEPYINLVTK